MKGVVLAGGAGTRLWPLTRVTNKHLLPVYDQPMIAYPLQTLVRAGIDEVAVVVGGPHAGDFVRVLQNGDEYGVRRLTYLYQQTEGGIAQALALAERFADGGPVTVILGDNTTDAGIALQVATFAGGAHLFLKQVPDPERFGVPSFGEGGQVVHVTEKPAVPASRFAVTGLYLFDAGVFGRIRTLAPSARGELEIADVINQYIAAGAVTWSALTGYWSDAGTVEALYAAGQHWRSVRRCGNASAARQEGRERALGAYLVSADS